MYCKMGFCARFARWSLSPSCVFKLLIFSLLKYFGSFIIVFPCFSGIPDSLPCGYTLWDSLYILLQSVVMFALNYFLVTRCFCYFILKTSFPSYFFYLLLLFTLHASLFFNCSCFPSLLSLALPLAFKVPHELVGDDLYSIRLSHPGINFWLLHFLPSAHNVILDCHFLNMFLIVYAIFFSSSLFILYAVFYFCLHCYLLLSSIFKVRYLSLRMTNLDSSTAYNLVVQFFSMFSAFVLSPLLFLQLILRCHCHHYFLLLPTVLSFIPSSF